MGTAGAFRPARLHGLNMAKDPRRSIHRRQTQAYLQAAKLRDSRLPNPKTTLQVIWRDPSGAVQRKTIPWHLRPDEDTLSEYMENYFSMVRCGYLPEGYLEPPMPHCARVFSGLKLLSEWHLSPKLPAESPVTAEPLGSGGIPTAEPSAPCSEWLAVPTQSGPCSQEIQLELTAIRRMSPDSIRAILTKG